MGENDRLVMHGSNGHAHGVEVDYGAAPLRRRSTMSMSSLARHESLPSLRGTCMGKLRDLVAKGIVAYSSPINWLLLFVPAGYLAAWLQLGPTVMFLANFIGMVPLALLLSRATEDIAERTSQTFGALLNVTLGNAVELIISISALRAGQLRLIQNTLVGSILSNLLLVLGSAFFLGGIVYKEQDISRAVSEANSDLLMFAVFGLAVPVAFSYTTGLTGNDKLVLEEKFSLVVAICMLAIYALFMVFATVTHADQFVDAGDDDIGGSEDGDSERMLPSMELAVSVLVVSIALVAVASEFLIGSIEGFAEAAKLSPAFIAVVLLPVIGNAVEHMSAVLVALHNKMDMSVGIAIGSSVQIALFATPLLVVLSWLIPGDRLTLVFSNFNVIGLILSVLVVNSTLADAKSNVLEGAVLVACYVVLATAYFLMPGI